MMGNFLYNGTELPDINTVWTDKETYPYAVIRYNTAYSTYRVFLTAMPYKYDGSGRVVSAVAGKYKSYDCAVNGTKWTAYVANGSVSAGEAFVWPSEGQQFVWASVDVYNDSGKLVYEATEPIDIDRRDGFILGFASGLCSTATTKANADPDRWAQGYVVGSAMRKALAGYRGELVAYRYNDAVLPPMPEPSFEAPYRAIRINSASEGSTYRLFCSAGEMYFRNGSVVALDAMRYCSYNYSADDNKWKPFVSDGSVSANESFVSGSQTYVWSNFDIKDQNGSIVYAGSDPQPVYEKTVVVTE